MDLKKTLNRFGELNDLLFVDRTHYLSRGLGYEEYAARLDYSKHQGIQLSVRKDPKGKVFVILGDHSMSSSGLETVRHRELTINDSDAALESALIECLIGDLK